MMPSNSLEKFTLVAYAIRKVTTRERERERETETETDRQREGERESWRAS